VLTHRIVCDPEAERDSVCGFGNPEHDGVADGLHVLPRYLRQLRLDSLGERDDELDRGLVSVCLRQRREARNVGE
jgi:hypothetical protein